MMASDKHDRIVTFIASKMQKLGFIIKYMEGNPSQILNYLPGLPEKINNHRPDVYGTKISGAICIGEAKTKKDLTTLRTKTQLLDFKKIVRQSPGNLLIIGIPCGVKADLLKCLDSLGFIMNDQIDIMEIPEEFLISK